MKCWHGPFVVKKPHFLPNFWSCSSEKESHEKVQNDQNFAQNLKKKPKTAWKTFNSEEKEDCEEIIGVNEENNFGPDKW